MLCVLGLCTNPRQIADDPPRLSAPTTAATTRSLPSLRSRFRMADVRALLRQQRQSRRIVHPDAAYSDAGKLLCTRCREPVRAESQWTSHVQSATHRQRAADKTSSRPAAGRQRQQGARGGDDDGEVDGDEGGSAVEAAVAPSTAHKRKNDGETDADDTTRRKRSRADGATDRRGGGAVVDEGDGEVDGGDPSAGPAAGLARPETDRTRSAPARRMSSTPSRGVEMQMPSRPATPAQHSATSSISSSSSTPGGSSLPFTTTITAAAAAAVSTAATATDDPTANATTNKTLRPGPANEQDQRVDEDEWAAFEAEIAAAATVPFADNDDAVISAPAMNAEESAAAAAAAAAKEAEQDDGGGPRKSRADMDIEGEREDASRALEDEFDDMQRLEARVQRLKDRRRALLRRRQGDDDDDDDDRKENDEDDQGGRVSQQAHFDRKADVEDDVGKMDKAGIEEVGNEDEEEEEEDEEDEGWEDGFRFRR